jgi:hypothetical protein
MCSQVKLMAEVPLRSYIVRVYRREKDNPRLLVGVVEVVGTAGRKAFTNFDELWGILNRTRVGRLPRRKISGGP